MEIYQKLRNVSCVRSFKQHKLYDKLIAFGVFFFVDMHDINKKISYNRVS